MNYKPNFMQVVLVLPSSLVKRIDGEASKRDIERSRFVHLALNEKFLSDELKQQYVDKEVERQGEEDHRKRILDRWKHRSTLKNGKWAAKYLTWEEIRSWDGPTMRNGMKDPVMRKRIEFLAQEQRYKHLLEKLYKAA
jgi:hypothetical protein